MKCLVIITVPSKGKHSSSKNVFLNYSKFYICYENSIITFIIICLFILITFSCRMEQKAVTINPFYEIMIY